MEALKKQIHLAEVDLNYTKYFPLSEVYISLYPPAYEAVDEEQTSEAAETKPRPPMWAEIEKCTEEGTLDQLRNRAQNSPVKPPKTLGKRAAKPKPQAPTTVDFGRNRKERRSQHRVQDSGRAKNNSMAFGASPVVLQSNGMDDGENSDGGFFEE